jgi:hypothetical protein
MVAVVTAAVIVARILPLRDQASVRHANFIGGGTSQINMLHSTCVRVTRI